MTLKGCLYFYDKVSCSSVCPWTCYVAEDDLKQLIILPLLPSAVIRGILHHTLLILLRKDLLLGWSFTDWELVFFSPPWDLIEAMCKENLTLSVSGRISQNFVSSLSE